MTDPATRKVHAIDVETGGETASVTLPKAPGPRNGISGAHDGHREEH